LTLYYFWLEFSIKIFSSFFFLFLFYKKEQRKKKEAKKKEKEKILIKKGWGVSFVFNFSIFCFVNFSLILNIYLDKYA